MGIGGAGMAPLAEMALLHWLPMVWADYWILYVDADYSVALVGNPSASRGFSGRGPGRMRLGRAGQGSRFRCRPSYNSE